jgi:hypothetical protein
VRTDARCRGKRRATLPVTNARSSDKRCAPLQGGVGGAAGCLIPSAINRTRRRAFRHRFAPRMSHDACRPHAGATEPWERPRRQPHGTSRTGGRLPAAGLAALSPAGRAVPRVHDGVRRALRAPGRRSLRRQLDASGSTKHTREGGKQFNFLYGSAVRPFIPDRETGGPAPTRPRSPSWAESA